MTLLSGNRFRKDIHDRQCHSGGATPDFALAHNKTLAAQLYGEMRDFSQ